MLLRRATPVAGVLLVCSLLLWSSFPAYASRGLKQQQEPVQATPVGPAQSLATAAPAPAGDRVLLGTAPAITMPTVTAGTGSQQAAQVQAQEVAHTWLAGTAGSQDRLDRLNTAVVNASVAAMVGSLHNESQAPALAQPGMQNPIVLPFAGKPQINDMVSFITPKGYPLEQHVVVTSDGYKLGTFRIPYGKGQAPSKEQQKLRPPVLLVHGISLSSTCWVVNDPPESLAFILADAGYDVWLMNTRGNTFSRSHVRYTDTDSAFWNFAIDQFGTIDLPDTVDYMISTTGRDAVAVIGHSQGGTIGLMALARNVRDMTKKIKVMLAVAPVWFARYMTSPVLVQFCQQANTSIAMSRLPPQEFLFMSLSMQQLFLDGVCQVRAGISSASCVIAVEGMFGVSQHITVPQYRKYWTVWPSSTSFFNVLQWAQNYNEGHDRLFQFGYGPTYELGDVKVPVVLFSAGQDVLSAPDDVAALKSQLVKTGMLSAHYQTPDYSHMDYIWDTNARRRVYPQMLASLKKYMADT